MGLSGRQSFRDSFGAIIQGLRFRIREFEPVAGKNLEKVQLTKWDGASLAAKEKTCNAFL